MKVKLWRLFAAMSDGSLVGGAGGDDPPAGDPAGTPPAGTSGTPVGTPPADSGGSDTIALLGLETYVDPDNKLLLGKYNDVKAALDGYKELSAKVREKNPGAPEDGYQFDFSAHDKLKDVFKPDTMKDDALWQAFEPKFKELGITQAQAQGLMETNLLWQLENLPDLASEKARLGAEADTIVGKLNTLYEGAKTEGEKEALQYIGRNADAMQLVYKLLRLGGEQGIPLNAASVTASSKQDLVTAAREYRAKNPDIDSDPAKQAVYDRMMRQAFGG